MCSEYFSIKNGKITPSIILAMNTHKTHFNYFRSAIVGLNKTFSSPYGEKALIYADWTASGRLYKPVEEKMLEDFGPFVGNTHSESSETGTAMTLAYREARQIKKRHVNAGADDLLLTSGVGMTGLINKLQRILGLKVPQSLRHFIKIPETGRPVVFVTHMEHHSNQVSWLETLADVEIIPASRVGFVYLFTRQLRWKKLNIALGPYARSLAMLMNDRLITCIAKRRTNSFLAKANIQNCRWPLGLISKMGTPRVRKTFQNNLFCTFNAISY
jgi:hypothetical protein